VVILTHLTAVVAALNSNDSVTRLVRDWFRDRVIPGTELTDPGNWIKFQVSGISSPGHIPYPNPGIYGHSDYRFIP